MSDMAFVDTNVLIYAHDVDAKAKHTAAKGVLRELWSQRTGVLSVQVLQEFYVNVPRKIAKPLPKESARPVVNSYSIWCTETTPIEIAAAFRIEDESRIGFWDTLNRCLGCQIRSRADSLRGLERSANDRGHSRGKPICSSVLN